MTEAKDPQQRDLAPFHSWGEADQPHWEKCQLISTGEKKRRRKGVEELKTLASYQVVQVSAKDRQHQCTLWASVSRTWNIGKQTKPMIANTQTEVCVFVYARVWDSVFMQTTNTSYLASVEMNFPILGNFKCIPTSWTRKCSVQLSKIKSYLYCSCVIINFFYFYHFWIRCKWPLRLIVREWTFY